MLINNGTPRTHSQHLYSKLLVHIPIYFSGLSNSRMERWAMPLFILMFILIIKDLVFIELTVSLLLNMRYRTEQ